MSVYRRLLERWQTSKTKLGYITHVNEAANMALPGKNKNLGKDSDTKKLTSMKGESLYSRAKR